MRSVADDDQAVAGDALKRETALAWAVVAIVLKEVAIALETEEREAA